MASRIIDIAKEADVSPATVSFALNNKSGVSKEVRQRVIGIAEKMGYKNLSGGQYSINENITIRLLKIAKHGHIINDRHNAFITEYLEGIETEAKKRKYKLEVSFYNRVPINEIVESQKKTGINGFIILGTELNDHELAFFEVLPQPIVFIDTYFPISVCDCIDMDNTDGVFRAIRYLYNCGHRSIGLIRSSYETRNFKMREAGFREVMGYYSLPLQENYIISVDPAYDASYVDMMRYLDKHKSLPTAFFCMSDITAYGCIKALREHGYKIPDDISIIGFDDLPSSSFTDPPLTTIQVSAHQIGQRALERVAEKINGLTDTVPEKILIAGDLVIRNSVRTI